MFRTRWCYIALDGFWGFSELHYCTCGWLTNVNFVCVIIRVWIWSVMAFWWWVGVLFQWTDLKKFVGRWFCIGSSYQMFSVIEKWSLSVLIFFYIRCALCIHPFTTQCTFKTPKQPKIKRIWALEIAMCGLQLLLKACLPSLNVLQPTLSTIETQNVLTSWKVNG